MIFIFIFIFFSYIIFLIDSINRLNTTNLLSFSLAMMDELLPLSSSSLSFSPHPTLLPRRILFHFSRLSDPFDSLKDHYVPINSLSQTRQPPTSKQKDGLDEAGEAKEQKSPIASKVLSLMAWKEIRPIGAGMNNLGSLFCFPTFGLFS
jgi:hypothetical protein